MLKRILFMSSVFFLVGCHSEDTPFSKVHLTSEQVASLYAEAGTQVEGKANAPVSMVEVYAYDCRYCRQDYPLIKAFAKQHPEVRIIFKSFKAFGDQTQVLPQYAALAAGKQGKFLLMHDALMSNRQEFSLPVIDKIARRLGLNMTEFTKAMNDPAIAARIDDNTALMNELGVGAIPAVFITQTAWVNHPEKFDDIPQYVQIGFVSNDILTRMTRQVEEDDCVVIF